MCRGVGRHCACSLYMVLERHHREDGTNAADLVVSHTSIEGIFIASRTTRSVHMFKQQRQRSRWDATERVAGLFGWWCTG